MKISGNLSSVAGLPLQIQYDADQEPLVNVNFDVRLVGSFRGIVDRSKPGTKDLLIYDLFIPNENGEGATLRTTLDFEGNLGPQVCASFLTVVDLNLRLVSSELYFPKIGFSTSCVGSSTINRDIQGCPILYIQKGPNGPGQCAGVGLSDPIYFILLENRYHIESVIFERVP